MKLLEDGVGQKGGSVAADIVKEFIITCMNVLVALKYFQMR